MRHNYTTSTILYGLVFCLFPLLIKAQTTGEVSSPYKSIRANSVSAMAAQGDTLWVGPGLNRSVANAMEWDKPTGATEITGGPGRVFSLALYDQTVIAGLGYNSETDGGTVQTGYGFQISDDGGEHWNYIEQPLDESSDTEVIYGGQTYAILPITVPQQSPPYEVDLNSEVIFSANWASGILRSTDFGKSWQRLLLPPFDADSLVPEGSYEFTSQQGNRYDPRADQNLLGFGILIDNEKTVWAGTAGGINISDNAFSASRDSVRWIHIRAGESEQDLPGNWVIDIKQNPSTGDIWMASWDSGLSDFEQSGIVRTSDNGETFKQYLIGERINNIGFKEDLIFATGDNGLFISADNGESWSRISQIKNANTFIKESARYLSVASTTNRIWIGTSDGLASSEDRGNTWQITRVNFPLEGGNQYAPDAKNVDTFAYPNPFSPGRNGIVRLKFKVAEPGNVTIRLFDFGMNLIKKIVDNSFSAGTFETTWDGTDKNGQTVATGPVFYQVDTPGQRARGKILIVN